MHWSLNAVMIAAAILVLVEAFNKLERTDLSLCKLRAACWYERAALILRGVGWLCAALAAGGAIFIDQVPREYILAGYALAVVASACLIARARLEERFRCANGQAVPRDAFDRTMVFTPEVYTPEAELKAALPTSIVLERARRRAGEETRP